MSESVSPNAEQPADESAEEAPPMNRAERRRKEKGKSAAAGNAFGADSHGVRGRTGPATSQRQWSNRRSGG